MHGATQNKSGQNNSKAHSMIRLLEPDYFKEWLQNLILFLGTLILQSSNITGTKGSSSFLDSFISKVHIYT